MLWIDPLIGKDGEQYAGFFIRNRQGKCLAIGAKPVYGDGFLHMSARRYTRDRDLVAAIERLTRQKVS